MLLSCIWRGANPSLPFSRWTTPISKLTAFLVAQEFFDGSLTDGSGIQVYDLAGNLVESIDGLNFQGGFNVFPVHITLNPSRRMGFVNGPDLTTAIQSFSY